MSEVEWPQFVMAAWLGYSTYQGSWHVIRSTHHESSTFTAVSLLVWWAIVLGLIATLSAGGFW